MHSWPQIYNESIIDLLKPGSSNLQLREDVTRGCFVDGLSEEIILNGEPPPPQELATSLKLGNFTPKL